MSQQQEQHKHVGRFGDWARHYDKSLLQLIVFRPVFRRVQADIRAALTPFFDSEGNPVSTTAEGATLLPALLDLGCGTGQLLVRLMQQYPQLQLYGVDPAEGMLAVAHQRVLAAAAAGQQPHLQQAYAEDLPFADDSFDLVTTTISFHHWSDQHKGLAEIRRVLKPAGTLIVADIVDEGLMRPLFAPKNHGSFRTAAVLADMLQQHNLPVTHSHSLRHLGGTGRIFVCKAPAIAFTTLGCPKNEVDTNLMRTATQAAGYLTTDQIPGADAIVVNTCAFIKEASETSIDAIFEALNTKGNSKTAGEHVQIPVIVAGCLVNRYPDDLPAELPEVAACIKVGDCDALLTALQSTVPVVDKLRQPVVTARTPRSYEYLRIADGCDRHCSFCTIPRIRGPYTSRPPADIVSQARAFVAAGSSELILIAQDIGRYGSDLATPTNLVSLLQQLAEIPGLGRLRLMYLQPEGLSDQLLATMARYPAIVPYLEVPLQHSSPRILQAMGRNPQDVEVALRQLTRARQLMPELSIRTTLIAGFPGETQEEFDQLCDFVRRNNFDYVGVFPYSPEEGTPAAALPDQLSKELRLQRAQQLRDVADQVGHQRMTRHIGTQISVLVEGYDCDDQVTIARAAFQAPDIDGVVRIVAPDSDGPYSAPSTSSAATDTHPLPVNRLVKVRVHDVILYDLEAEMLADDGI
ncbi:MAG: 30S ribosomal protein S12 methylthiotransferase RimO [Coriobacteriia bacterium]|nr:30S ribosomal protein S12 methylthiotransferase RimO [Coriobacteriia bacterium]